MYLPGRHESVDPDGYRYGFQGQELDNEVKGEGNSYNYTFRMHDPRLGRFFAVDPLFSVFPELTPYNFTKNSPIRFIDFKGLSAIDPPDNVNAIQNLDKYFVESMVDMANSKSINTNSIGWPRDRAYFWEKFRNSELGKEALSQDNINLLDGKSPKSPIVDERWNNAMKKYGLDGNEGEVIEHHHHNKGRTAYPRPKSKHTSTAWNNVLHKVQKRYGKVRQTAGYYRKQATSKVGGIAGKALVILDVASIFMDTPHSPLYQFGTPAVTGKAFYDDSTGLYFEYTKIAENSDGSGYVKIQGYEDYDIINGEWRGIIKVGVERTLNKDVNGNIIEKEGPR